MNSLENAFVGALLALGGFGGLILIVAAILLLLLPFFVFRIRNEIIEVKKQSVQINRNLATLTLITREVHKERIPVPKPCPQCAKTCRWPYTECAHCQAAINWD